MGMYAADGQTVSKSSQFPTVSISLEDQIKLLQGCVEELTTKFEQSKSENEKIKTVLAKTVATYKMLLEKKDQRIKESDQRIKESDQKIKELEQKIDQLKQPNV
jgi:predicted RNase H-like nuclease (RuvC/YqgF family)